MRLIAFSRCYLLLLQVICSGKGDVLNVGFGLGIVDEVRLH